MDEKNLAVLEQLKQSMAHASDPRPKTLDPKMLLSLLTEVNLRLHGTPKDPKRTKKKGNKTTPGNGSKSTTKATESKTQSTVSAKAVRRQGSNRNSAERKIIRERAAAKAQAAANAFKASQQIRPCMECGMPTKADTEFFLNPVMCQRCKDLSRDIDLGVHPRKHDDFSEITVFKGGAPGLGRRK